MDKKALYRVDEYGVRDYKARYLALISFLVLYLTIAVFAVLLFHFESTSDGANIQSYGDAFWTLQMSASTIGFGDHYPTTPGGYVVVTLMFYIGVGMMGFIGTLVASKLMGFSDTNIKNRELRYQNSQILRQLESLTLEIKSDKK